MENIQQPKTPEQIFSDFWERYQEDIEKALKKRDAVTLADEKNFSEALLKGIDWNNIASPAEENPQPNVMLFDMSQTLDMGSKVARPSFPYLMEFIKKESNDAFQFQIVSNDSQKDIESFLENSSQESLSFVSLEKPKNFDSTQKWIYDDDSIWEDDDSNPFNKTEVDTRMYIGKKLVYIQEICEIHSEIKNIVLIDDKIKKKETVTYKIDDREINITLIPSPAKIKGKK